MKLFYGQNAKHNKHHPHAFLSKQQSN